MTNREAQIYLNMSRRNIDRIRELSTMSGVSYCCMGKLEQRQAELEYALGNVSSRTSRGNLGNPILIAAGLVAGVTVISGLIGSIWWHYRDTEVELKNAEANLIAAQCKQKLVDEGKDPSLFCPLPATTEKMSSVDKIVDVIKLAVIIGGIGLAFGIFKGFGKKI